MRRYFLPDKIFTGEKWLADVVVVCTNETIEDIIPASAITNENHVERLTGCFLAPAFIDLQIYGAGGKLFAVFPQKESLDLLTGYCNKSGTVLCLPTVATNTKEVFYQCIDAVRSYWQKGGKGVLGLHLEGPWINPVKRGAHMESLIRPPAFAEVKEWLEYGKGVIKMITVAPELCDKKIIELILSYDVVISAGHSNAGFTEAMLGFENGITAVTHLYNAMSPLHHRQPGLVGAAFSHSSVMASIIPDGHHVDYAAIRIAKKIMGNRLFAITDAVTETNQGFYQHQLAGDKYEADGILSGSSLTMLKALQNLVNHVGIDLGEALRMCSLYPAQLIKMDNKLGRIEKNYPAAMIVLDTQLSLIQPLL
jgi:N-acetylglucosamine-6-phosphate deacetylase